MGTESRWRATSAFAAALLGASVIVGLASARPAAGQVSVSASATVPTVDGVRRFNVGATHSPTLLQELSGSLSGTAPAGASAGLRGVDVADHEHPDGAAINWAQVASAGYRFADIKATEGTYYVNPYYSSDVAQAKAAGLYVMGYHFAVPNISDGITQADYAVSHGSYAADGRTLPMVLDIEYDPYVKADHTNECYGLSAAKMVAWITGFDSEVERLTGQRPIIYTTADWWDACTGASPAFAANPLWVAAYGVGNPPLPAGWANWTFWQYTSSAAVPGIAGNVDANYFNSAMVTLADPGSQSDASGTRVFLQVNSLDAAALQTLNDAASGLPAGLSISGGGQITGTIWARPGTYPVTVTAARPSGARGSVSFTWTVTPAPG